MQNQLSHPGGSQLHENKRMFSEEKVIGDIATVANMIMYISYIGEILQNLNGQPTSFIQLLCVNQRGIVGCLWLGEAKTGLDFDCGRCAWSYLWVDRCSHSYYVKYDGSALPLDWLTHFFDV